MGGNKAITGLFLSTLSSVFLFAGLYGLVAYKIDYISAKWSVIALGVYPTTLFLIAPFSESLFLAFTLGMFLFANKKQWSIAGCCGFLTSLSRGPGILNIFPLAMLMLQEWREQKTRIPLSTLLRMMSASLLTLAGGISFLLWRGFHEYPSMSVLLNIYSITLTNPLTGFIHAVVQWINVFDLQTTLDVMSALIFLVLLLIAIVRWRKFPIEWLLYWGINLSLYLSKIHYTASSLQSMSRYVLTLFPAFILIGQWLSKQSSLTRYLYNSISATLLIVLTVLYSAWIFVG
jgi:hypothetical protein